MVVTEDDLNAELAMIAENLHRADLTTLQRNEQVAEWIALTEAETVGRVLGQPAPKPRGGRPEGGVRAAARELGIEHKEARRATKIAGITTAAKEAARSAGLDNNQTALLRVAAAEPERQAAVVQEIVAARPAARTHTPPTDPEEPFRPWIEEGRRWLVPPARFEIRKGGRANLKGLPDRHRLEATGGRNRAGPCKVAEMYLNRRERTHGMVRAAPLAAPDRQGSYTRRDAEAGPWPRSRPHPADGDFGENSGAAGEGRGRLWRPCLPTLPAIS